MTNPFANALAQLSRAAALRSFNAELMVRISHPEREITVHIPVQMDDGSIRVFEGYRVQHSSIRGPFKGGIRFHPETNMDEVRALALWMTMKTAVAGIPMGGGKGGVTVDSKTLSKAELERLSRGWVRALAPVLGPKIDVPAPDMNTTPEIMSWMVDEYAKISGDTTGATFTGKPLENGGSEGRGAATGMGGFFVFDALRAAFGIEPCASVAIQGMGNVGGHAAKIFVSHGYRVVAMSDSKSGIYEESGLDVEKVEAYKKANGSLVGFPGARQITNAELLELPADVLIPAAMENQITADNAQAIKAKLVLELANGPTTPEADDVLFGRGIPVVPDILANSGGVIVSSFEWEQNLKGEHWPEQDVFEKLRRILAAESQNILIRSQQLSTDMRRAAFVIALERLEMASKATPMSVAQHTVA